MNLRNLLAIEYCGNRRWPTGLAEPVTEIGASNDLPALSAIQQERQSRIYRNGAEVVRGSRATSRLESRLTSQLTVQQDSQLRAQLQLAEQARLEVVVQNFQTRQEALRTAA